MRRPKPLISIVALGALAILTGLGVWQLERRDWKLDLIATIDARLHAPALTIESAGSLDPGKLDLLQFRQTVLKGHFLHDKELYLHAIGPGGEPGVQVITPLVEETAIVLVNRGFVPVDRKDPATRAAGQVTGEVALVGVIRLDSVPGWMTPPNEPDANYWYTRDWKAMAAAAGLDPSEVLPFIVEADGAPNPGGWPLGGQTRIELKNDHLQYALTWFGLALTLVGVFIAFHWKRD